MVQLAILEAPSDKGVINKEATLVTNKEPVLDKEAILAINKEAPLVVMLDKQVTNKELLGNKVINKALLDNRAPLDNKELMEQETKDYWAKLKELPRTFCILARPNNNLLNQDSNKMPRHEVFIQKESM